MRRIEQEWKTFVESLFSGKSIPKLQYQCMRSVFYAGVITMFSIFDEIDRLTKEDADSMLDGIVKETVDFMREARLLVEAKNKSDNV